MIIIQDPNPNHFAPPFLDVLFFGFDADKGNLKATRFIYNSDVQCYEYHHKTMGLVQFDNTSEFNKYVVGVHNIYWLG